MGQNGTDARWVAYRAEMDPIEARVEALDRQLWERATALSGLGAARNVWTNALIAREDFRPWSGVDYAALREALYVDNVLRPYLRDVHAALRRAVYSRHYPDRVPTGWPPVHRGVIEVRRADRDLGGRRANRHVAEDRQGRPAIGEADHALQRPSKILRGGGEGQRAGARRADRRRGRGVSGRGIGGLLQGLGLAHHGAPCRAWRRLEVARLPTGRDPAAGFPRRSWHGSPDLSIVHVAPSWFVHAAGTLAVNAKALADVLKTLPDADVTVRAHTATIAEISCGALTATIPCLPARDFPKLPAILPDDPVLPLVKFDSGGGEFACMVDSVKASVCLDETRFHMNGALLEASPTELRMVTTDGHRLAKVESGPIPGFTLAKGLILPTKPLCEARRLVSKGVLEIGTLDRKGLQPYLVLRQGGTTVAIKPVDADFPSYRQVIPSDNKRLVTVDRNALKAALDRAKVICTDTRGVRLETVPNGLKLTADHPELGTASETIAAELNPESRFVIGANPRYLLDAIASLALTPGKGDRMTISFGGELDPMVVRSTDCAVNWPVMESRLLVVIMPMRV